MFERSNLLLSSTRYYYLLQFKDFSIFFCIFSLESQMVKTIFGTTPREGAGFRGRTKLQTAFFLGKLSY